MNQFSREELLLGSENVEKLHNKKVVLFGLGGVGSYVLEGLVRAGIESFVLVDSDEFDITNINRQVLATHNTIGKPKVEVARQRILDINPNAKVEIYQEFFLPNSKLDIINKDINYVIDCVDTVSAKIEIIIRSKKQNVPVISCMGTGNKLDPTCFKVADIYSTKVCPLCKVMRKELKERNIDNLKVVYSEEEPIKIDFVDGEKRVPGSISFVPSVAGLIIAGEVIKDLINN